MDGVLVIDKPAGCTSHDVVARARRALGETRIGHTGTLDPFATGVLPLVIGRATRLASFLSGAEKEYDARIRFGCATDTFDATGVVAHDPAGRRARDIAVLPPDGLSRESVEQALSQFRGAFDQQPPRYSAKKIGGVPAHRLVRRNRDVQPSPVRVSVARLELSAFSDGVAEVRVCASAGFYVRSLAHDLGAALGCGAYLEALRRLRSGSFTLADAVPLEVVQREGAGAAGRVLPLHRLLPEMPAVHLTDQGARKASHGNDLVPADVVESPGSRGGEAPRIRLLDGGGRLLGLAEPGPGGLLHPVVVLV